MTEQPTCPKCGQYDFECECENVCLDMHDEEIEVGDTVKLYALIGKKFLKSDSNRVVGVGKVWKISNISSHKEPLIWVTGIGSCHHPRASRIKFKSRLTKDAVLYGLDHQQKEIDELKESNKTLNDLCASHEARILSDSELIEKLRKALSEEMAVVDFYGKKENWMDATGRGTHFEEARQDDITDEWDDITDQPNFIAGKRARTRIAERKEL